jgi:hypothetical protein
MTVLLSEAAARWLLHIPLLAAPWIYLIAVVGRASVSKWACGSFWRILLLVTGWWLVVWSGVVLGVLVPSGKFHDAVYGLCFNLLVHNGIATLLLYALHILPSPIGMGVSSAVYGVLVAWCFWRLGNRPYRMSWTCFWLLVQLGSLVLGQGIFVLSVFVV